MAAVPPDPVDRLAEIVAGMGGTRRPSQEQMVREVAGAIEDGGVLLVQAGTGTGKSLGYLVPAAAAAAAGRTVLIATATLALQRQLVSSDLPTVARTAPDGSEVTFEVLKGRGNYLCRARLAGAEGAADTQEELGLGVAGGRLERQAARVRSWAEQTDSGDRDDYPDDVDERVWRSLSATGRECVGAAKCGFADECFSELARIRAAGADIVVTNHALLALDAIGGTGVVPEHDVLVVDEAHELTARTTAAATGELSVRDAERAVAQARRLLPEDALERLAGAVDDLGDALAALDPAQQSVPPALVEPLAALRDACHVAVSAVQRDESTDAATRHRALAALEEVHDVAGRVLRASDDQVTWVTFVPVPALHVAPLSVGDVVGDYLRDRGAAVLTSATLTIGGDFDATAHELGLRAGDWRSTDVGSPFSYAEQAILYVAADLPRPGRDGMDAAVLARIRELVDAARGRTMVLLSSWRSVEAVAAAFAQDPPAGGVAVHVQRRGEPVARLVAAFTEDESSVLVGTMSLFQGVDVPGSACVCVIIDRIPFPRPDDPVLSARVNRVAEGGGNGFMAVSVPRAALLLAQGTGRLIRSTADRGVVAVLDPRLATARYGSYLRRSMPPFWTTTDTGVALAALRRLTADAAR